jgi:hypothetical protein
MRTHFTVVAIIGLFTAACSKPSDSNAPPETGGVKGSLPASGEPAYVTSIALLRHEPVDDQKVADKTNKTEKMIFNAMAMLQRGETVTMLENKPPWVRVRAADESVGWLHTDVLVSAVGVKPATLGEEIGTYDRPQLVAINPKRKIPAGALLFVLRAKDQFSEVDQGGGRTTWVKTDNLLTDNVDVEVSKLLAKADWLAKQDASAAAEIKATIGSQFPGSRLLGLIEPKEAPPATREAAPTAPQAAEPERTP